MSIRIAPLENARLQLSGDVEDEIRLSARALDDGFAIAISDGTLVRGSYDSWLEEYRFAIVVEGAGITKIDRAERGDAINLAWKIEWISIAVVTDTRCPEDSETRQTQRDFPFSDKARIAA